MKQFSHLVILGGILLAGWLIIPLDLGAQPPPEAAKEQAAEKPTTPEQIAFFEKHIRPVLVRECYSCHATTAERIRGGLTLDTRDGLRSRCARRSLLVQSLVIAKNW
jgi:hypothetical protein